MKLYVQLYYEESKCIYLVIITKGYRQLTIYIIIYLYQ